jgi:hypothetical protein
MDVEVSDDGAITYRYDTAESRALLAHLLSVGARLDVVE